MCVCVYVYIYIYIYIYTHTHTHTHTESGPKVGKQRLIYCIPTFDPLCMYIYIYIYIYIYTHTYSSYLFIKRDFAYTIFARFEPVWSEENYKCLI